MAGFARHAVGDLGDLGPTPPLRTLGEENHMPKPTTQMSVLCAEKSRTSPTTAILRSF